jgi:hypothetical protein
MTVRSYVDADTAFSTGLTFWTASGVPGIQVSTPRSIVMTPFGIKPTPHRHTDISAHHRVKIIPGRVLRTAHSTSTVQPIHGSCHRTRHTGQSVANVVS